jgi:hypothetical protein
MTCKQCGLEKAQELDAATIRRVASMTNRNQHTQARITLAKAAGHQRLQWAYLQIQQAQTAAGHLSGRLSARRNKLDNDLIRAIRAKFTNAREVIRAL